MKRRKFVFLTVTVYSIHLFQLPMLIHFQYFELAKSCLIIWWTFPKDYYFYRSKICHAFQNRIHLKNCSTFFTILKNENFTFLIGHSFYIFHDHVIFRICLVIFSKLSHNFNLLIIQIHLLSISLSTVQIWMIRLLNSAY